MVLHVTMAVAGLLNATLLFHSTSKNFCQRLRLVMRIGPGLPVRDASSPLYDIWTSPSLLSQTLSMREKRLSEVPLAVLLSTVKTYSRRSCAILEMMALRLR